MEIKSRHAQIRAQQRGVSQLIIDLLLEFGTRTSQENGAEICYFDRRSKSKLNKYAGGTLSKLSDELDAYAILCGGKIVTVGTRFKRINHA